MAELLAFAVLSGFTVWRVTSALHDEWYFTWLRKLLRIEENGNDWLDWFYPENIIGRVWGCFMCLSTIVALIPSLVAVSVGYISIGKGVLLWLASATVALATEKWVGRSKARFL